MRITVQGTLPNFLKQLSGFDGIEFVTDPEKSFLTIIHGNHLTEILSMLKNSDRRTKLIVLRSLDFTAMKTLTNDFHTHSFFQEEHFFSHHQSILTTFLKKYFTDSEHRLLIAQGKKQLRELEFLNSDLQKMVEERTNHIAKLKKEEESRLTDSRALFKFINSLGHTVAIDEMVPLLKKEFQKQRHLEGIYLLIPDSSSSTWVYGSNAGKIFSHRLPLAISALSQQDDFESSILSSQIANVLGRPVLKIFYRKFNGRSPAWIGFEWGGPIKDFLQFNKIYLTKQNVICLNLDRLFFDEEQKKASYFWEKTFDGIQDPIAIVDKNKKLIRCNRPFLQNPELLQVLKNLHTVGQLQTTKMTADGHSFEVSSYSITGTDSSIHHFMDVTRVEELYLQWIQQEKMGALGALAGNIAHELYNPLTGIRSLSQILITETSSSSTMHQDLIEIEKAAERCQEIITNLLDFTSKKEKPKQLVPLNEIVIRTIPLLKVALRPFRQVLDLEPTQAKCFVVQQLVQQVIFNLVNNACQAMGEKGELQIRTWVKDQWVHLSVSDTGPGIAASHQSKIFQSFFTTKKEGFGTGLGLSLSKKIVEGLGGKMSFSSQEGQGATFNISFPCVQE